MKKVSLSILILCLYISANAQSATEQYIQTWYKKAVEEMHKYGIPASITLAQGIIESGSGKSELATMANNHFGIKCHKEWTGETFTMDDDAEDECFRKYPDAQQSFDDHSMFLKTRERYASLFLLESTDYKGWAKGLKDAGYATNPAYPELLTGTVERYGLDKYDKMSLKDIGEKESDVQIAETNLKVPTKPHDAPAGVSAEKMNAPAYDVQIHDVFYINRIKTIKAKEGDTPLEIAVRYEIPLKLLMKWNDMIDERQIPEGQNIFLQPKRGRAPGSGHMTKKGESMYDISQIYGIRVEKLYERNQMSGNEQPELGETILLNGTRDNKPRTRTYGEVLQEKNELEKKRLEGKSVPVYLQEGEKSGVYVERIYVTAEEDKTETRTTGIYSSGEKSETESVAPSAPKQEYVPSSSGVVLQGENKTTEPKTEQTQVVKYEVQTPKTEVIKTEPSITTVTVIPETKTAHKGVYKYTVGAGDTLYNISQRFGTTVDNLKLWNLLTDNTIRIGQELIVSQ